MIKGEIVEWDGPTPNTSTKFEPGYYTGWIEGVKSGKLALVVWDSFEGKKVTPGEKLLGVFTKRKDGQWRVLGDRVGNPLVRM